MQLPNAVHDYSDFFRSGFRAFTSRGSRKSASSHNSLYGSLEATDNTSSSLTLEKTVASATKGRPRAISMAVESPSDEKHGRRWSSFLTIPSQLFDRLSPATTTTSFDKRSTISSTSRSSTSSRALDRRDSVPGVFVTTEGGPYTLEQSRSSHEPYEPTFPPSIDPFCSLPGAKSTYIDLDSPLDDLSPDVPKRNSFISFASSSNHSSLLITTRREPPPSSSSSIHTRAALPSRQSSFQCLHHYPLGGGGGGQEKSDFSSLVVKDATVVDLVSLENTELANRDEDRDAPAEIDWRQFHVDILTDDDV